MDTQPIRCFLPTYAPLVWSRHGREAAEQFEIEPFVDGSIRREPDLEHDFPAITCLCRTDKFAPRLRVGDIVGYLTKQARYEEAAFKHHRLTAVLRVMDRCDSHKEAANWYRARGLPLPNNCMIEGNPPKPLAQSHMHHKFGELTGDTLLRCWDKSYWLRSEQFGIVVICEVMFRDLSWDSPYVDDELVWQAFGRSLGTRNPGALPPAKFMKLLDLVGVELPPSSP